MSNRSQLRHHISLTTFVLGGIAAGIGFIDGHLLLAWIGVVVAVVSLAVTTTFQRCRECGQRRLSIGRITAGHCSRCGAQYAA